MRRPQFLLVPLCAWRCDPGPVRRPAAPSRPGGRTRPTAVRSDERARERGPEALADTCDGVALPSSVSLAGSGGGVGVGCTLGPAMGRSIPLHSQPVSQDVFALAVACRGQITGQRRIMT